MQTTTHPLLPATPGMSCHLTSHRFGPADAPKKIYIQAALHADEIPGMLVAVVLMDRLRELEAAGALRAAVTLVPVANPAGLAQTVLGSPVGRFDLGSGQNFNRGFPMLYEPIAAAVEGSLGSDGAHNVQVIRRAMADALRASVPANPMASLQQTLMLLAHDADVVLDLHCSRESPMHIYTGEAIWAEVEPLARYLGAKASLLALDAGGQSFDEAFSYTWYQLQQRFGARFPIPHGSLATTVEHRGQRDVSWQLAEQDAAAILNYLTHAGAIAGTAPPLPPLPHPATPLAGSEYVAAPVSGIVVFRAEPGAAVQAGQVLFDIVDPVSGSRTPVAANTAGVFFMGRDIRFARHGDPLARVAGNAPARSGYLLSA
ncbi:MULTISPECIES: succinylglutamate desuccinylase/aspartoacylase family protein [Cupriavidus]